MIFTHSRGKLIGIFTGLLFMVNLRMGIAGFILGCWLGSQIEEAFEKSQFQNWHNKKNQTDWPKQMIMPLFSIMGYIAKVDGTVSPRSIQYTERLMKKMRLNTHMARVAIQAFNHGKSSDFNLQHCLNQIRLHLMFNPTEQQSLIQNFAQIAHIDGQLSPQKREALQKILAALGRGFQYQQRWGQQQQWQQYQQQENQHNQQQWQHDPRQSFNAPNMLAEAHQTLGTKPSDPLENITKKYRKLLSKYHPDRIHNTQKRSPSEQEIKLANERTHRIKQAYETIKASKVS
ncbi:MAG: co-chaperone DjlA [Pseudomonadota bacterium]|nr:co-chaperone DjlA [Pseudomonadota bacterium]